MASLLDRLRARLPARPLDRLPAPVRTPAEVVVRTVQSAMEDRITGLAAEIAFWMLLSLPSVFLVAASAAGLIGDRLGADVRTGLIQRIEELALQVFAPSTVEGAISPTLDTLLSTDSVPLLSLSFLAAVYAVSRVLRVVVLAITIAYNLGEQRPTWMARVLGLVLTLVALLLGLVLIPLVVAGPRLGEILDDFLDDLVGVDLLLSEVWRLAYWPVSLTVVALLIAGLYHSAAPWKTPFYRELPGAVLATLLGLLMSLALRVYTQQAFEGDALYATLAAPVALLIWVWLQGIGLLLGAELNSEIEQTWPRRRDVEEGDLPDRCG
ncbi:YihY/virulence factor BrkB family protein [soil metagenome]